MTVSLVVVWCVVGSSLGKLTKKFSKFGVISLMAILYCEYWSICIYFFVL